MPINRGMYKETVIHPLNGILLSHKKDEILLFATKWSQLESIILSEVKSVPKGLIPAIFSDMRTNMQI